MRVQRMAIPLMQKGHCVNLIADQFPSFYGMYNQASLYLNKKQLKELLKIYDENTDIYHAHNEPSWYVSFVKEHSNKPVILDIHDTHITRTPEGGGVRRTVDENNNFRYADGLVFVSEPVRDEVINEYGFDIPNRVLTHYSPEMFTDHPKEAFMGGLVYEGMIKLPQEIDQNPYFKYCDYIDFAKQAKDIGINFHIYSRDDQAFADIYQPISALHNPVSFKQLIKKLTRHEWGFVGNSFHSSQWEKTAPNKLFDYISAGIPIIAMNAKWSEEFVTKHGIGIVVESVKEIVDRWDEHKVCKRNLLKKRQELTMENHIHILEELYREVINANN
jgi:glycosyltransferase involved in cell wall biosynthesis